MALSALLTGPTMFRAAAELSAGNGGRPGAGYTTSARTATARCDDEADGLG